MWFWILFSLFIIGAGAGIYFIVNRYNELSNTYDDLIDEVDRLVIGFKEYANLLDTIERSDILIFDPIINELVNEAKELNSRIEKTSFAINEILEQEEEIA